jgi:prolyl-tRNA editing enzyme YbaK/EbsC (Cys-tRNA(Pro) deacylase)
MAFPEGVELLFVESVERWLPDAPDNLQAASRPCHRRWIVFPGAPPTVPAAAAALGVEADQIVKSVIFWVDDRPFLVYGCGTRRVDPRKLAMRLQVGRKRVKLANADQVLDLTGYAVGTVPPLGLKTPMPAYGPSRPPYGDLRGWSGIDAAEDNHCRAFAWSPPDRADVGRRGEPGETAG